MPKSELKTKAKLKSLIMTELAFTPLCGETLIDDIVRCPQGWRPTLRHNLPDDHPCANAIDEIVGRYVSQYDLEA